MPNNDTTESSAAPPDIDVRKPLKEIDATYIWSVQFKHFLYNSCVKWVASWTIAYAYVIAIRAYGVANL